jgi:prenyltransferase beta subunit
VGRRQRDARRALTGSDLRVLSRIAVGLFAVGLALSGSAAKAAARHDAAFDGASWLAHQQKSNGAFFSTTQKANDTAITLAALVAGGVGGEVVGNALDHIRRSGSARATRGGFTGQIIAGIVAGGADPEKFGGVDYVKRLRSQYKNGAYDSSQLFDNLLGANGALAADEEIPSEAVDYIAKHECDGGGFGYDENCPRGPDADTTALAINVLTGAGDGGDMIDRARDWVITQQHADGGWGFTKDLPTSTDSTALVLSAIEALGEDAASSPWRQGDGDDPVKAVLKLQDASGGFRFHSGAAKPNGLSTIYAVPGLAGVSYPVPEGDGAPPRPPKTPKPTPAPTDAQEPGSEEAKDGASAKNDESASTPAPSASDGASPTPEATGSADAVVALTDQDPDTDAPFADSAAEPIALRDDGGALRTAMAVGGIAAGAGGIALGVRAIRRRRFL